MQACGGCDVHRDGRRPVTLNLGMEFLGEESFGLELGVEFFVGEDEAAV
jgi:hypothetical protein